jgi:nucleoside-diphosphate-sugar epimerase
MKVLITGGAGYIGSALTGLLLYRGHKVTVYDALHFGIDPMLPYFRSPNFELVQGDIRDGEALKRTLQGADAIIHLAAVVGYPACKRDPAYAESVNLMGTRVLNLARSSSQPILFASTGSVYGAVAEGMCSEDTPVAPLTVYGRTKADAEKLLMDAGNVVAYRFATAFGLSARQRLDLLVNDFCYQAVQNRSLVLYEAHHQRTFLHVQDIARAFVHALDNFAQMRDQVYNCGGFNASKKDIAAMIKEHTDYYLHLAEIGKDEDQRNYTVFYDKLYDTGYLPKVTLQEGIAEMVRAFRFLKVRNPYSNVGV